MQISADTLLVNGETKPFDASLVAILDSLGVDVLQSRGVAVAINDAVVRKKDWETHTLTPGDRIEVITARQGG